MRDVEELPARLRRETADLHRAVEAAVGLPDSVRSRDDYVRLLQRLHAFHTAVEDRLAEAAWADRWGEVGVDLPQHRRAHLLARDLVALQEGPSSASPHGVEIADFPGALGCLYVVEGSSLGGRVIGPAIRSAIGDVPIGFFDSTDRDHPSPWRSLKAALARFGEAGDAGAVVRGARDTFHAFERQVAAPGRASSDVPGLPR
jgi:heme oxygenase